MISDKLVNLNSGSVCFMEYDDTGVFDFSPQQVFDVVADIERYPEFLPGWRSVKLLDRENGNVTVEQEIGFPLLNWRFESRAILEPPYHISIKSTEGPFPNLEIRWGFAPVDKGQTKVSVIIHSNSAPGPQHRFLHAMLSSTSRSLLDYFRDRVSEVYSQSNEGY